MKSRNEDLLKSFTEYCTRYPDLRFWQALRNWARWNYVYVSLIAPEDIASPNDVIDTYSWEENRTTADYPHRFKQQ
jgi:hypothetical protein